MRIAYGIHGYGRGHATRALSVLQSLTARHEVQLFAGGDAYETLQAYFPVQRIPCLGFGYKAGRRSHWQTLRKNLPALSELMRGGPSLQSVIQAMRRFEPDAVVCDAEPWTRVAGRRLRIPTIGFDHFGILVHCRVGLPLRDWFASFIDRFLYRRLLGGSERVLVSSFFGAEPRRGGVRVVGPLLGEQVRRLAPVRGQHLLAYFNQGSAQLSLQALDMLAGLGIEVRLYGLGRVGSLGQLMFRPAHREAFLDDLASCRAVLSTAGNQLMGEAMACAKPILAVPEATVEQRLNAREIVRLGIGEMLPLSGLTRTSIWSFLERAESYASRAGELARDGQSEAVAWLERWFVELGKSRCAAPMGAVLPA
ncbi:MAG TPA: glycosyltransferase family protein [Polyangiaceae bacterium]|nr:glycosyltransferase family protein [Polyangiaceae bacterium]